MSFANLVFYKIKVAPGFKTTTPAGAKRCIDSSKVAYYASNNRVRVNVGCNSNASTIIEATPQPQAGSHKMMHGFVNIV
jgi:hypothetical protein